MSHASSDDRSELKAGILQRPDGYEVPVSEGGEEEGEVAVVAVEPSGPAPSAKDSRVVDLGRRDEIIVGLSWDMHDPKKPVDLDASCVVFDMYGQLMDAVFYNQLEVPNVVHSGDSLDGEGDGFDETITISLKQVEESVTAFMIVISCYGSGTFQQVETATAKIVAGTGSSIAEPHLRPAIAEYGLGVQGTHESLIMAMIYRNPDDMFDWKLRKIGVPVLKGRTFQAETVVADMSRELEFVISRAVQEDAAAMAKRKKTFNLKKGEDFRLTGLRKIYMGLGWDTRCDLDASCVEVKKDGTKGKVVKFGDLKNSNGSIQHSGDNLTGEGSGDDERINVDLSRIPRDIAGLFFTINIYTEKTSFTKVKGAYCRLVEATKSKEICRYKLGRGKGKKARGMVMCCVYRSAKNPRVWQIQALGAGCAGRTAKAPEVWEKIKTLLYDPPVIPKVIYTSQHGYEFQCHAVKVDKKDFLGKSDPYFYIMNGTKEIYRSQILKQTLNPRYAKDSFKVNHASPADKLILRMYDWDKVGGHDYIGEFEFRLNDILTSRKMEHVLINAKKRKKNKSAGTFVFDWMERKLCKLPVPNPIHPDHLDQ